MKPKADLSKSIQILTFLSIFTFFFSSLPLQAQENSSEETKTEKNSKSFPVQLTWIDLAFANFVPLPGTRLDDFTAWNYGAMSRIHFSLFNIEPLWVTAGVLYQHHIPDIYRIDTLNDYSFFVGGGWRFKFRDLPLGTDKLDRFYFTPRYAYGYLLHVTYGDYYNDHNIYPGHPEAGIKKTRYFSDTYHLFEAEFAYDLTPTFQNYQRTKRIRSEIFFSPTFIYFPEELRDGYEAGYFLGIRIKGDFSLPGTTPLAVKIIDKKTKKFIGTGIVQISGSRYKEEARGENENALYKVNPDNSYTLTGTATGYSPEKVTVSNSSLKVNIKKTVTIELDREQEWGLYGNVYLKETKEPLSGTEIFLLESGTPLESGRKQEEPESTTDQIGFFRIPLDKNKDYDLVLKKEGYFTVRGKFSTKKTEPGWYPMSKFMKLTLQESLVGAKIDFESIYYDSGSYAIRPESETVLNSMVEFLQDNPKIVVELSAHTDSNGSKESNKTLSENRAKSAVDYIIAKGIPSTRISPKGYGEEKILNGCWDNVPCNAEKHQANRRTEFRVRKILD